MERCQTNSSCFSYACMYAQMRHTLPACMLSFVAAVSCQSRSKGLQSDIAPIDHSGDGRHAPQMQQDFTYVRICHMHLKHANRAVECSLGIVVALALQVKEMLDAGIFDMQQYVDGGWITGLKYDDEVLEDLKKRTGGKPDKLRAVSAVQIR